VRVWPYNPQPDSKHNVACSSARMLAGVRVLPADFGGVGSI
jgi:hypothetical protein